MGGIFAEVILPEGVASYPSEAATLAAAVPTDPTLGPSCVALIAYSASGGRFLRSWADLPATAIKYIRRIEELIDAPVALLSTSPEREDVVLVHDPFAD